MSIFSRRAATVLTGSGAAVFVTVLMLAAGGQPVFSQKPGGGKEMCRADVKKFCGGIESDRGRIMQCLQENREYVSAPCRKRLEMREKHHEAFQAACGGDAKQFCGDARGKKMRACMKKNHEQLSTQCKALLEKARKHEANRDKKNKPEERPRKPLHKDSAKACRADARKYCKGIQPGDGKLIACLVKNKTRLSSECSAAISSLPDLKPGESN